MTGDLKRRRRRTQGRWPCEDGGGHWSDAFTRQGSPWISGSCQKLEEARKGPPLEPSERTWPCQHLEVWTFSLQDCERINSCVVKPPSLWHFVTSALGNQYIIFQIVKYKKEAFDLGSLGRARKGESQGDTEKTVSHHFIFKNQLHLNSV